MNNTEHDIFLKAIGALWDHLGLPFKTYPFEYNNPADHPRKDVLIIKKIQEVKYRAVPIVFKEFREQNLIKILDKYHGGKKKTIIIVAEKIYPKAKTLLQERNIDYLDTAGNGRLFQNDFFIQIEGKKIKDHYKETPNRAFTKAGLKFIFHLIHNPDLINANYRMIKEITQVATGNIKFIINGLLEEGFLIKNNNNTYTVTNLEDLQERWITAYGERLKPTLAMGKFRFLNPNDFPNWKNLPVDGEHEWWGGEPAGALYTDYLKPGELTIYTTEKRADLMKKNKLVPDPQGNVMIFQKFWNLPNTFGNKVPPFLTYADLILAKDPRCFETAIKIHEQYIAKNI